MSQRTTGEQRRALHGVAEKAIMKYADDHYLWHKHVHNVELDAIQILKCHEMDKYPMTLDFSSRRMGKTAIKELYFLKQMATTHDQELGIVAPRQAQAQVNLGYHLEAIRRSEMLDAFVEVKQGRKQMADTYYQFANKSKVSAFGIMANVDGGDLTCASLEEVDDMPHDRLFSRFLLMLGGTRRLGASKTARNDPAVRITGVYKGADTLVELIESGEYFVIGAMRDEAMRKMLTRFYDEGLLGGAAVDINRYEYPVPVGNALIGMDMGLLNRAFIESMRVQLGVDEFCRQLLCVNTKSRNLIWEDWLQRAVQMGVSARLEPVVPMPGEKYQRLGRVSLGYDHTGHGENPESSKSALIVLENLDGYVRPLYAKQWPMGTDESSIARDIVSIWRYFMPDEGAGDAFGVGLIGAVNDALYKEGLIDVDRMAFETTRSNWHEWTFSPIAFEGMVKHSMAVSLAGSFSGGRAVLPYVAHIEEGQDGYNDVAGLQLFYRQLVNIKAIANTKSYASYVMVKREIGDDLFDAAMAAHHALMSGGIDIPTRILLSKSGRADLLTGTAPNPLLQ